MKYALVRLDRKLTGLLQDWPPFLRPLMLLASFLGLPIVTAAIVTIGLWVSFGLGNESVALALLLCFVAMGVNLVLKLTLQRARPETLYASSIRFNTYSFPSGHSFSAFMLYGLCAYLASEYFVAAWAPVLTWGFVGLIILVGLSRIYLGAHYLLDVFGGWVLGGFFLWLILVVVRP